MSHYIAPASERNKDPILNILKSLCQQPSVVLEIGSGSGQHARYFTENLPHIIWQPSERPELLAFLEQNLTLYCSQRLLKPIPLDVCQTPWPNLSVNLIFTANTLHIMSWEAVELFWKKAPTVLKTNGLFCAYGPFNYHGQYTSPSNAEFDIWLKQDDPNSGIRDFEKIDTLAEQQGFKLKKDYDMPANNRLLVWGYQTNVLSMA